MTMRKHLIFASALTLLPLSAQATPAIPNDCWSGVMVPEKAPHGLLVASGPVMQWRVGVPLVLYTTKEDFAQLDALAKKGQTGTYDISHPITVVPTWISGPEPGDKDSGEDKSIEVMIKYCNAQGETGVVTLSYWSPTSGQYDALPPDQKATMEAIDQQMHDSGCRGIP